MKRPLHIWIVFALCLAVVFGVMGWVSVTVLSLERTQIEAGKQAALEETVRLALWRLDSALIPLIAQESGRAPEVYTPFYHERVYTQSKAEIKKSEVLIPSPLLTQQFPYILLHFQIGPDGAFTSPQVPTGNMRDIAELSYVPQDILISYEERLGEVKSLVDRDAMLSNLHKATTTPSHIFVEKEEAPPVGERVRPSFQEAQYGMNVIEFQKRQDIAQQAASNVQMLLPQQSVQKIAEIPAPSSSQEVMIPVWIDDALILGREVVIDGANYVQGCRLDWPALHERLCSIVSDILPEAVFHSVESGGIDERSRMLTALPVKLDPGVFPGGYTQSITPLRIWIIIAWVCIVLAAAAVALLLMGTIALSERRAAFVSAVTHELRTPLTTLRMYTEMLSEGMIPDESKRRDYIATMTSEADRLTHLVENVLAYSRLEGNRIETRLETVALRDLLKRNKDRLSQRAAQEGMEISIDAGDPENEMNVRADPSAVEQILFNLVDNAAKYASQAADRRIHIEVSREHGKIVISVRDHGPGISKEDAARLFLPFRKSAKEAANSAPGVGLGLALSRRLARMMKGDLVLDATVNDGACFILKIPAV